MTRTITPAKRKLIDCSMAIYGEASSSKEAAYMARQLIQVTLPHKNPGDVPGWSRKNGNLTLGIQPGFNHKTGKSYGYPYGIIPRLLLFWLITEAVRTKNREIQLGNSLSSFMIDIGLIPSSAGAGKRSDAKRLREQMERLFNAFISFEGDITSGARNGKARINMVIASSSTLWWNPREPDQPTWGSSVVISQDFYDAITAAPVPVDMRALRALKKSPLALDLYAWLAYEAFRAHKNGESRFETWEQLHSHLGGDYTHLHHFRAKAKAALAKIQLVYPGLRLGKRQGGIEVLPDSLSAIQPRTVTIDVTATRVEEAPAPADHHCQKPLSPATLEKFRRFYPRLDPYACQADFDAWQAGLAPSRQAKVYDRAFLGFAVKWAEGKF